MTWSVGWWWHNMSKKIKRVGVLREKIKVKFVLGDEYAIVRLCGWHVSHFNSSVGLMLANLAPQFFSNLQRPQISHGVNPWQTKNHCVIFFTRHGYFIRTVIIMCWSCFCHNIITRNSDRGFNSQKQFDVRVKWSKELIEKNRWLSSVFFAVSIWVTILMMKCTPCVGTNWLKRIGLRM